MIRKRTTLTTAEKRRWLITLLFLVVLCGVLCSLLRFLWHHDTPVFWWHRLPGCFFFEKASVMTLWMQSLFGGMLILLCLFLFGFSAIGQPGALVTLMGYGFCLGEALRLQCAGAYAAIHCIALLPYYVPLSMLLVIASRESLRFSGRFTAYGFRDGPTENMYHQFRLYCTRFAVLLLILTLLSLLYSLGFSGLAAASSRVA